MKYQCYLIVEAEDEAEAEDIFCRMDREEINDCILIEEQ